MVNSIKDDGAMWATSMQTSNGVYLPVCLYTKILTRKDKATEIICSLSSRSEKILIFVADELHALSMMNRGYKESVAFSNAKVAGRNIKIMYHNISTRLNLLDKVKVLVWEEVRCHPFYKELVKRIEYAHTHNATFAEVTRKFIQYHIQRGGWVSGKKVLESEQRYLFEEIAASLYVTEVLGYTTEIWERPLRFNEPDPIGFLYSQEPDLVRSFVEKDMLQRNLHFLIQDIV